MLSLSGSKEQPAGSGLEDMGTSSFSSLDGGLRSLQWLEQLSSPSVELHQLGSDGPTSPLSRNPSFMEPLTPEKTTATESGKTLPRMVTGGDCTDRVDYRTNAHVKPPYSCATLICMAMQDSRQDKISLSAIYEWISDNFCYYRHTDTTWRNSVRHSLSLHKSFIKVPREKGDPGKGAFWKVEPHYAEHLLSKAYKATQMSPVRINLALQSRLGAGLPLPARSHMDLGLEQESQQLFKGHLYWDAQLDADLSLNEGDPQSFTIRLEDLTEESTIDPTFLSWICS